ncbi:MAG: S-methyl-5-thioribose-1-phosphate isomerase [Nitrososphaerales archaeon]
MTRCSPTANGSKSQRNAGALATVGYGTALGVVRAASEAGRCIQVVATETRPALQGARLTTYELSQDGFHVTLIADTVVGLVMTRGMIDKVIVGADRITQTGHIFNKIGTYPIAVLAKRHSIPFYCAAPASTFDLKTDWREVEIEERSIDEVIKIGGRRMAAKKVKIFNPAFDVTPPELVTAIITERGLIKPDFTETIPKLMQQ